jgi:hypothetical protein
MIAFAVVFPDELPIPLLDDGRLEGDLRIGEMVRREIRRHQLAEGGERRRLVGETDEDVAGDAFAGDRLERMPTAVKPLPHLPREGERAVEIVGPLMIGADQLRRDAALGAAHPAAAMTASVVEGADDAVAVAQHDDRIGADLHREVTAGLGQLAIVAREQPVAIPNQLEIEIEELLIDIERLGQRIALGSMADQVQHLATGVHLPIHPATPVPP